MDITAEIEILKAEVIRAQCVLSLAADLQVEILEILRKHEGDPDAAADAVATFTSEWIHGFSDALEVKTPPPKPAVTDRVH